MDITPFSANTVVPRFDIHIKSSPTFINKWKQILTTTRVTLLFSFKPVTSIKEVI